MLTPRPTAAPAPTGPTALHVGRLGLIPMRESASRGPYATKVRRYRLAKMEHVAYGGGGRPA